MVQLMQGLNGRYTRYFNRKHERVGHLFQGRYRGIVVEKERYLLELSRYIHLNPVRAKIVDRPEAYGWSSYRGYIGQQSEEPWVEYGWVLAQCGRGKAAAQRQYRVLTEAGLDGSSTCSADQ